MTVDYLKIHKHFIKTVIQDFMLEIESVKMQPEGDYIKISSTQWKKLKEKYL